VTRAADEFGIGPDIEPGRRLRRAPATRLGFRLDHPVPLTARVQDAKAILADGMCPSAHRSEGLTSCTRRGLIPETPNRGIPPAITWATTPWGRRRSMHHFHLPQSAYAIVTVEDVEGTRPGNRSGLPANAAQTSCPGPVRRPRP
jgi:hypothetical protein